MKKQILSFLLTVILLLTSFGAWTVSASATGTQNDRTASYAEVRPEIDGVLDAAWNAAELHLINGKTENQANFRVMWDETGLYVAVLFGVNNTGEYISIRYSERATASLPMNQTTGLGIGNQNFILNQNGVTEGQWLNEYKTIPVNGEDGVKIICKPANGGGTLAECYFPLKDSGAFNNTGDIIFSISYSGNASYNSGVIDPQVLSDGNAKNMKWGDLFYRMKRVRSETPDARITWLGAQQTSVVGDKCDVRFVAQLSNYEQFSAAGLEIATAYGTESAMQAAASKPLQTYTVYTSLAAGEGSIYPTKPNTHLLALAVNSIPVNSTNSTVIFTVKPFAVIAGGAKVYGEMARFRLVDGVLSGELVKLATGEVPLTVTDPQNPNRTMILAWNDEFNGSSLDSLNWQLKDRMFNDIIDTSDGSDKHIKVENGSVVMNTHRADASDPNHQFTTHGTLTTMNRMSFQYGYLEIRARLPYGTGTWPSFWLQSLEERRADQSVMTEVDVFELYKDDYMESTLHKWYLNANGAAEKHDWNDPKVIKFSETLDNFNRATFSQEYHTYGFGWTATEIYFTVDGKVVGTYDITDEGDFGAGLGVPGEMGTLTGMDFFRDPLFVNFTNWVHTSSEYKNSWAADEESEFPFTFAVDYIRLYQVPGEGAVYTDY